MAHEYIKENDTFSMSRNGTVPKPTSADVSAGKVLKADGTWGEGGGGGGSSTLAGLTDVNLSSPSEGQILKYDAENDKWVNDDESGGTVTDVNVNGESVVDGNGEAQIKSYKEVTLAEYNALPDSKLSDGILYCIKDVGGANQFPPLIYSDEEREVGVWRDGKPLYQKSFYLSSSGTSEVTIDVSSLSIDTFLFIPNASYKRASNNGNTVYLGFYVSSEDRYQCFFRRNANQIAVMGMGSSYLGSVTVTIQYTKTTDTPGSGTWTTDGTYAKHYSTEEKVIGTWVDGKPLYERVFEQTTLNLTANTWTATTIAQGNMKCPVNIEIVITSSGTNSVHKGMSGAFIDGYLKINSFRNLGLDIGYTAWVVLQYTKTTD